MSDGFGDPDEVAAALRMAADRVEQGQVTTVVLGVTYIDRSAAGTFLVQPGGYEPTLRKSLVSLCEGALVVLERSVDGGPGH